MISVIVCSADQTKARDISLHYAQLLGGEPFEMISISDARSLAEGYNRGIARSQGDVLIFSHDDIEILRADLVPRLHRHLHRYDIIGVAGTSQVIKGFWVAAGVPYTFGQIAHKNPGQDYFTVVIYGTPVPGVEIQSVDGVFIACKRRVVDALRFDEHTFDGFHCYDTDFTFAAYLAGFRLGVCTNLPILHDSSGTTDESWLNYMQRFDDKYQGRLPHRNVRTSQFSAVQVQTKAEILEVMCPEYLE